MTEPHWPNVTYTPIDYQAISYYSAPKTKKPLGSLDEVDPKLLETYAKLGIPLQRAEAARRASRWTRSSTSVSVGTTYKARAGRARHHLLLVRRGGARASRAGAEVPRLGRAGQRQLLRRAQRRGVQRRLVRVRAEGRALPDGAVDVLPHQHGGDGPVRAHADRRRRGRVRELPRGLHGAQARREPAARRGGRARGARGRDDQVLDGPELVCRRRGRAGRHLQLRDQARQVRRRQRQDLAGRRSRPARRSPGSIRA